MNKGYVYDGIYKCKCIEEVSDRRGDMHCNHSHVVPECNCPNRMGRIYVTEYLDLILLAFVIAFERSMPRL